MIGANLDQPGVSSVPDEALMKAISRRRYDAPPVSDRHGKRLRATIDGVVHEEGEADDVLGRSLSRFGKKQPAIHLKRVSRSDGWLQSRVDVPSTACAGVRLILARESVIKSG
jgi:hypothetical protein